MVDTKKLLKNPVAVAVVVGVLVAVIAAPVLIANHFDSTVMGVAFYGILMGAMSWVAGGWRAGLGMSLLLALLGPVAILMQGHVWMMALLLILLGLFYGYASSKGASSVVLQLPILVPYFMFSSPGLSPGDPVTAGYLVFVAVTVMLAGAWTTLVLTLLRGDQKIRFDDVPDSRLPLIYGAVLGAISVGVMAVGEFSAINFHWVWVTLTLYVLADPTRLIGRKKTVARVLGTTLGSAFVGLLIWMAVSGNILTVLAILSLWACLVVVLMKKSNTLYYFLLTVMVVLMTSKGADLELFDAERVIFTFVGAVLAIVAALLVNLIFYHRVGFTTKVDEEIERDLTK